jgi:pterin-4a-carbinolamine dehydratase
VSEADLSGRLTAAQFSASPGVADWRVLWGGGYAAARYLTGSFAGGLALVAAIGELAAACGHDPDVDIRAESVTVRPWRDGSPARLTPSCGPRPRAARPRAARSSPDPCWQRCASA